MKGRDISGGFPALGRDVFGLGLVAMAVVGFVLGDFVSGQAVPKDFPARVPLAYLAAGLMLVMGAGLQWRRTAAWAALAAAGYFGLVVTLLMGGRVVLRHLMGPIAYTSTSEQLAIASAAVALWAGLGPVEEERAQRTQLWARRVFGVCALLFGLAHFLYMNLTAPLVPTWLPPSQLFWGYATGAAHIAAGLALISGVRARLAAILLTLMYAAFTPLVHLPMVLHDPRNHFIWSENATNLLLTGAAWVMADTLRRRASG